VPIFILCLSDGGIWPYFHSAAQITGTSQAKDEDRHADESAADAYERAEDTDTQAQQQEYDEFHKEDPFIIGILKTGKNRKFCATGRNYMKSLRNNIIA
jgi:hypothetical protein